VLANFFGTGSADINLLGTPLHKGVEGMRFFENWWERAPLYARIGLFVASLVAIVVGGGADAYWE
jgi:hypothetical protein